MVRMAFASPLRLPTGLAVCLALLLSPFPAALAHGDDELLIEALTEAINESPEADLHIRRGELFRHHQEWERADADFAAAARLEPQLTVVDYFRGRTFLESGAPEKARPFADRYLRNFPDEAEGWFLRGEILAALGDPGPAAADYGEGLQRARRPRPEHYLRQAQLLAASGADGGRAALAAIDAGIARIGPVVTLLDRAIALELEQKNFDGALERIDTLMKHTPRAERWLIRRADILVQSGRTAEAIRTYRAALSAIEELPERHRSTHAMAELIAAARSSLERLLARQ
jgi:predicted Zn-dependent protease